MFGVDCLIDEVEHKDADQVCAAARLGTSVRGRTLGPLAASESWSPLAAGLDSIVVGREIGPSLWGTGAQ
jgi:hypothetical protein